MSRTARRVRLIAAATAGLAGIGSVFAFGTPANAAPTVTIGGSSFPRAAHRRVRTWSPRART